jgi:U3 small nucleolar RNA-associated protein 22
VAKFLSQKKQRKDIGSVHIVNEMDGDYRKVSLILTPPTASDNEKHTQKKKKGNDGSSDKKKKTKVRFRVRLVFGAQFEGPRNTPDTNTGWIPSARLFPDRCNNKVAEVAGQEITNDGTPVYNTSLAMDMHLLSNTQILSSVSLTATKAFTESWTLLKIWCLQRGLLRGHDTFTEMSLGMTLAYLYRNRMVSPRMDNIQVFTVWMKFMSDQDWLGEKEEQKKKVVGVNEDIIQHSSSIGYQDLKILSTRGKRHRGGVVMPEESMTEKQTVTNCIQNRLYASDVKQKLSSAKSTDEIPKHLLESYKMSTDAPIFLDPSMTVNYFANISPSFMREVQMEAKKSLECIHFHRDNNSEEASAHRVDPFRQLFLEHIRFWRRYDAYLSVDLKKIVIPNLDETNSKCKFWGSDAQDRGTYDSILNGIVKVLTMALGDRISALRILTTGNGDEFANTISKGNKEIGTQVMIESDGIQMIPIRHTNDSEYSGLDRNCVCSSLSHSSSSGQITIGVRINRETCNRLVDRGPPANETKLSTDFVALWGKRKAQLRRFKDGAIVHAVVWNEEDEDKSDSNYSFENGESLGDIVERVIRHILRGHFVKGDNDISSEAIFKLRGLLSLVEGAKSETLTGNTKFMNSAESAHKNIVSAYEKLSTFLKKNSEMETVGINDPKSKIGLPLSIDAVEALSPALRYSSTFPQIPHALLGSADKAGNKVAGAISSDPILIQIRFEGSSKWPNDISAMGAAKCAMLTQIAEGVEEMKEKGDSSVALFDGPMYVSPTHIDFGYSGYVWRVVIRADQEMHILNGLRNPSPEAVSLRQALTKNHITRSQHHFTIHGVTSKHPSAGYTIRLLNRWVAAHMLSGQVPLEAIELLVASVFTDPAPLQTPTTVSCGFLRCLQILANHDWVKAPLIVDPEAHIHSEDRATILSQFEEMRGAKFKNGPVMYIISPNDRHDDGLWRPSFTQHLPEKVVLGRLAALAKKSQQFLINCLMTKGSASSHMWSSIFQESPGSLKSYSALFRVDPDNIIDTSCSSTAANLVDVVKDEAIHTPYYRTIEKFTLGPKMLRKKVYKNLNAADSILYSFKPIDEVMNTLRSKFGRYAIFFYNEFCPDMIAMLWRPDAFERQPFSAMHAEFTTPIDYQWGENSLVTTNSADVLRSIKCVLHDFIVDTKILDQRQIDGEEVKVIFGVRRVAKKHKRPDDESSSSEDTDSTPKEHRRPN